MVHRSKVFIDSNVWFSAFYKKGGTSQLIEKLFQEKFEIIISEIVLEEIVRNIKNKLSKILPSVYRFFQEYPITIIKNPTLKKVKTFSPLADKKDLPILISAVNYKCNFFITGNTKDFKVLKIEQKYNLKILTPKKALVLSSAKENQWL